MSHENIQKEERRGQDSSEEENIIIPEICMWSRLSAEPGRPPDTSVSNIPGTSGLQVSAAAPLTPTATRAFRPRRLDRDRLFWTLMSNTSRSSSARFKRSVSSQRRTVQSSIADLLEPERRFQSVISRCPSPLAFNNTAPHPIRLDASLRNLMKRRSQERGESSSTTPAVSAANAPQLIFSRPVQSNVAPDSRGSNATQVSDEGVELRAASPQEAESSVVYMETVIEVRDDSINTSTEATPVEEEVVEVDSDSGARPDQAPLSVQLAQSTASAPAQDTPAEESPSGSSQAPNQQVRGTKRKREVTGDAHESVATLNKSLLRLLECPVCMEWMDPPIAQCRRGHLVCGKCRKRLETCPVCRTSFSSVRNRAMEDVAGILRYPCRHGCGREVRHGRRSRHEASCSCRRYSCPLAACESTPPMPYAALSTHFQSKHPLQFKTGVSQRVSLRVNCEQRQHWVVSALGQLFSVRVDVDVHTWGVVAFAALVGPQSLARNYTYEVAVTGRHNQRKLVYRRATHSDLENSDLNTSRQDCFHLTLDQALNFLRFKNEHSETDKTLEFTINLAKCENEEQSREVSDPGTTSESRPLGQTSRPDFGRKNTRVRVIEI